MNENKIYTMHCSQNSSDSADMIHFVTLYDIKQALKSNMEMKSAGGPTVWNASPEILKLMELIYELMEQTRIYCNSKNWQEKEIKNEDLPLITNRHINKATEELGMVYRVKTNFPNEYPEIGCIEVQNATKLLSAAYATKEHLEKKHK